MPSLAQKVALVTGVTRRQGIGAAVALALAQAGADVCTASYRLYDRHRPWGVEETEPEQILRALRQMGGQAHGVETDLVPPEGPHTLFTQAQARFGRLDILVKSAAVAGRGITVNAVDPGPTDTGWMPAEQRAALLAQTPMGRLGTPQDAARVVAFLASEEAGWVTGQVMRARGSSSHGAAPDCLQRPLVPRARFWPQVSPGVRAWRESCGKADLSRS